MQWKKFLAVAAIALVVSCALSNAARADILPGSKLWQQMVELFRINPRMPSVSQTDRHSPDPVLSESHKTRTPVHSVKSDTVFTPGYHYHEPVEPPATEIYPVDSVKDLPLVGSDGIAVYNQEYGYWWVKLSRRVVIGPYVWFVPDKTGRVVKTDSIVKKGTTGRFYFAPRPEGQRPVLHVNNPWQMEGFSSRQVQSGDIWQLNLTQDVVFDPSLQAKIMTPRGQFIPLSVNAVAPAGSLVQIVIPPLWDGDSQPPEDTIPTPGYEDLRRKFKESLLYDTVEVASLRTRLLESQAEEIDFEHFVPKNPEELTLLADAKYGIRVVGGFWDHGQYIRRYSFRHRQDWHVPASVHVANAPTGTKRYRGESSIVDFVADRPQHHVARASKLASKPGFWQAYRRTVLYLSVFSSLILLWLWRQRVLTCQARTRRSRRQRRRPLTPRQRRL